MFKKINFPIFFLFLFSILLASCGSPDINSKNIEKAEQPEAKPEKEIPKEIITGAQNISAYLPILKEKNIALVVNQTSMVGKKHLVDALLKLNISVKKIFAPEHGFRGTADAGAKIKDGVDTQTGLPVTSLYGKNRKPSKKHLAGIDMVVFDVQDVGARFYTYISTMSYVMEACAENNIPFMVLDRPNPNGHYVDGPVLDPKFSSFIGLHKVPVVHGMTMGEYAKMVNGEGWLKNGIKCDLAVIECGNYDHNSFYELPIKPSPNLPNMHAIYLYPSICFFEGTDISVGRGTDKQFQVLGAPGIKDGEYEFTPEPKPGAKHPKHEGEVCKGVDLSILNIDGLKNRRSLNLSYLIDFYKNYEPKKSFFLKNNFFDKLAGTDILQQQIKAGKTENEIRESWQKGLNEFKKIRKKYLLYKDFE
ncbi:MAG TPA: DUF1343 domain-containing protein [Bacteroidetes bacterium]|nr:DUF1343 domain-containing protein [Bacteroidota bacterium]